MGTPTSGTKWPPGVRPPSEQLQVSYSGQRCVIQSCGEWHWSENAQITVETPEDTTRVVSRSDEWRGSVTGSACSLSLGPADGATGFVQRADWNRLSRTVKN